MNQQSTYAFYGSLRRGMRLYKEFNPNLMYQYSMWLQGYDLFSLGPYPCAVKSTNPQNKILVEIMQVTDPFVEKDIFQIEMNAAYYYTDIFIQSKPVGIFLYEKAKNYPSVHHGDWVKFFGH